MEMIARSAKFPGNSLSQPGGQENDFPASVIIRRVIMDLGPLEGILVPPERAERGVWDRSSSGTLTPSV